MTTLLAEAHDRLDVAGECLIAYRRGDPESIEAEVGAMIEAEFMLRVIRALRPKG